MLFNLKANHKPVQEYYKALRDIKQLSLFHEGAVAPAFANLLRVCASRMGWTLVEQYAIPRKGRKPLRADGVLLDQFNLRHGIWEAKDSQDDLAAEVKKKFGEGYPQDNILFQAPDRAILYQNGHLIADEDITNPDTLVDILRLFCDYQPPEYEQWETAVNEFKERVPELAQSLLTLIETERQQNRRFRDALASFKELMREALNPNLSDQAVEEMLIQHLLTERIFRKVFNNPDFAQRNIVAREIEKVIEALTSRHFSRTDFLQGLDRFYGAIETTAASITEYSEKQAFLNTVYENFFQGFSVKVADTHGIVYTPQPIVDFMVRSVDDILRREFGKTDGLASDGVAILDPFVGTGNFVLRLLRQMPKSKLPRKYAHELFCNEVMLLPYYIASMNIEHEYYELTGRYEPFTGISLVDTFELAEGRQLPLFASKNMQYFQQQNKSPLYAIISNPPWYSMGHPNQYEKLKLMLQDYLPESISNARPLFDTYVLSFRYAQNLVEESGEGVICFFVNNSFLSSLSFRDMRHNWIEFFTSMYFINLGGNLRLRTNTPDGSKDENLLGIMAGLSIVILVKTRKRSDRTHVFYHEVLGANTKKQDFLWDAQLNSIDWVQLNPVPPFYFFNLSSRSKLNISMLDNGTHSFLKGLEAFLSYRNAPDQWLLKDAIMLIHHGIELLMKQILYTHSKPLLFEDINLAAKRQLIANKDGIDIFQIKNPPNTVSFVNAIDRIGAFVNSADFNYHLCEKLLELNKYRNQLVHHASQADIQTVIALLEEIPSEFEKFLNTQSIIFDPSLTSIIQKLRNLL